MLLVYAHRDKENISLSIRENSGKPVADTKISTYSNEVSQLENLSLHSYVLDITFDKSLEGLWLIFSKFVDGVYVEIKKRFFISFEQLEKEVKPSERLFCLVDFS